ncbi:MAG: hypothetical protein Q8L95_04540, partial [Burkholderiales bacterium]|nr:hypothetical protein [Burkholderiales bacterium]
MRNAIRPLNRLVILGALFARTTLLRLIACLCLMAALPAWAVDLVMTEVSTTATSLPVNGTAVISTVVKNQGTTPMTTTIAKVGIYLST